MLSLQDFVNDFLYQLVIVHFPFLEARIACTAARYAAALRRPSAICFSNRVDSASDGDSLHLIRESVLRFPCLADGRNRFELQVDLLNHASREEALVDVDLVSGVDQSLRCQRDPIE